MFRLAFEFPAVGGVVPSQKLTTVKLLKYTNPEDYVLMASEFIFIIYILYYIVEESIEIKIHGLSYFFNIWNMLDICVIGVSFAWFQKSFPFFSVLVSDFPWSNCIECLQFAES